jgi:hypothetical protein
MPETSHPEYGLDQAPAEYIEKYAWVSNEMRRNLSAMVSVMDEAAGNVTASLKKAGMWEDTLFIFSTDVRFSARCFDQCHSKLLAWLVAVVSSGALHHKLTNVRSERRRGSPLQNGGPTNDMASNYPLFGSKVRGVQCILSLLARSQCGRSIALQR